MGNFPSQLTDLTECRTAIDFFALRNADFKLVMDNYIEIDEMVAILRTIHKTTLLLQQADATLSDYFGASIEMREKLKIFVNTNNRKTDLAERLLAELSIRKPQMLQNEAMLCAIYLDRRFSTELSDDEKRFARAAVYKMYNRICESKNTDTSSGSDEFNLESYLASRENASIDSNQQNVLKECEYSSILDSFEREHQRIHAKTSVLQFWKDQRYNFPEIYEDACVINAIPPAQATVERCFSSLKFTYSNLRCTLSLDLLNDILTIRSNQSLAQEVFTEALVLENLKYTNLS